MMALVRGRDDFAALSGHGAAPDWPNPDLVDAMVFIAATVQAEPGLSDWTRLFVLKESRLVIGEAGFKGLPSGDGAVEIGYGVAKSHRGRGLASEAVSAMCTWAFQQPGVRGIKAECLPDNIGSIGVLIRVGFSQTDSDAAMLRWEILQKRSLPRIPTP